MKRWLIRSVFLLPVLLCLLAWARSRTHEHAVGYAHAGIHAEVEAYWGAVHLTWEHGITRGRGFYYHQNRTFDARFWPQDSQLHTYWGFGFARVRVPGYAYVWASLPYWFLTVLCALLPILVWRKTATRKPGQGFPWNPQWNRDSDGAAAAPCPAAAPHPQPRPRPVHFVVAHPSRQV